MPGLDNLPDLSGDLAQAKEPATHAEDINYWGGSPSTNRRTRISDYGKRIERRDLAAEQPSQQEIALEEPDGPSSQNRYDASYEPDRRRREPRDEPRQGRRDDEDDGYEALSEIERHIRQRRERREREAASLHYEERPAREGNRARLDPLREGTGVDGNQTSNDGRFGDRPRRGRDFDEANGPVSSEPHARLPQLDTTAPERPREYGRPYADGHGKMGPGGPIDRPSQTPRANVGPSATPISPVAPHRPSSSPERPGVTSTVRSAPRYFTNADRQARIAELRNRMEQASRRRSDLIAQLGESLFAATRANPAFRVGREELYEGVERCEAECEAYLRRIEEMSAESTAIAAVRPTTPALDQTDPAPRPPIPATQGYECPQCRFHVEPGDRFCSGCGLPIEDIMALLATGPGGSISAGPSCPVCGEPVGPGDAYCMHCGVPLG